MQLSRSFLHFAVVLGTLVVAGCDHPSDSVTAPLEAPSRPSAIIVPSGYSHVSVGAYFACAIRSVDGGLVCWGNNEAHQATPPKTGSYKQVSAGSFHACALRTDNAVVCWGSNDFKESAPPAQAFSQVSAANGYTCAVRVDNRTLSCWGYNPQATGNTPAVAFSRVSGGSRHTCGITFDGSGVMCWGQNDYGQAASPPGVFSQVDVGSTHTCALRGNGTLACWGSNGMGEGVAPGGFYTQVTSGSTHSCALRSPDRAVVCWGDDGDGILNVPAGTYVDVSAGTRNTCAIRSNDALLVCWGANASAQLSPPGISTAHVSPIASYGALSSVTALDTFSISLFGAQVPGHPEATVFKYQFDCGDGKGYGLATTTTFARCPTRVIGTRTTRGKVIDVDGDTTVYSSIVTVKAHPQIVSFVSTAPVNPVMNTANYTVSAKASSGLPATISVLSSAACSISANVVKFVNAGTCVVTADQRGDSTYAAAPRTTQTVKVIWPFNGFLNPVRNAPYYNVMTAGKYVQLPFSLGANRGVNIVPSNPVSSQTTTCESGPRNTVPSTGVATVGIVWDSATGRYVYTWKTDASWAGTCRAVTITLADGTVHSLKFVFN